MITQENPGLEHTLIFFRVQNHSEVLSQFFVVLLNQLVVSWTWSIKLSLDFKISPTLIKSNSIGLMKPRLEIHQRVEFGHGLDTRRPRCAAERDQEDQAEV